MMFCDSFSSHAERLLIEKYKRNNTAIMNAKDNMRLSLVFMSSVFAGQRCWTRNGLGGLSPVARHLKKENQWQNG
jgi:hypothetical protein